MNTIYVQAAAGLKLPKEGAPRSYITDAEPVAVEGCHYYRKAIADGDLVELSELDFTAYQDRRERTAAAGVTDVAPAAKSAKQAAA